MIDNGQMQVQTAAETVALYHHEQSQEIVQRQ